MRCHASSQLMQQACRPLDIGFAEDVDRQRPQGPGELAARQCPGHIHAPHSMLQTRHARHACMHHRHQRPTIQVTPRPRGSVIINRKGRPAIGTRKGSCSAVGQMDIDRLGFPVRNDAPNRPRGRYTQKLVEQRGIPHQLGPPRAKVAEIHPLQSRKDLLFLLTDCPAIRCVPMIAAARLYSCELNKETRHDDTGTEGLSQRCQRFPVGHLGAAVAGF